MFPSSLRYAEANVAMPQRSGPKPEAAECPQERTCSCQWMSSKDWQRLEGAAQMLPVRIHAPATHCPSTTYKVEAAGIEHAICQVEVLQNLTCDAHGQLSSRNVFIHILRELPGRTMF